MTTTDRGRPFVLVHGAWHGGWCWERLLPLLREAGHPVYAPTLPGLGERAGELSRAVTLDVHIAAIVGLLDENDLRDVVLVGHSYAGTVVSGVADRRGERIGRLVYLDALVVEGGERPFDAFNDATIEDRRRVARDHDGGVSLPVPPAASFGIGDGEDARWLEARLTPHPLATYESRLVLDNPLGNGRPCLYVTCTDPHYAPLAGVRERVASAFGWPIRELSGGHDVMVTRPEALADLLLAEAAATADRVGERS